MVALSIVNAKKTYKPDFRALKGINLTIPRGEFFGLLGPNGAGKTTLIQSIVGLCRLTSGDIVVEGFDTKTDSLNAKKVIGYAPQDVNLDRFFTIRHILIYQAGFYGFSRSESRKLADQMLAQFDLTEKSNVPYYRLSGGMQKRLLIAKAVISNPKILILDEPTAGVDVKQRHDLWKYLKKLHQAGTTIILTTHYIDEAEELCERVAIIHQGEIREMGSPEALINRYCTEDKVVIKKGSLEDVFLKVTGKELEEK